MQASPISPQSSDCCLQILEDASKKTSWRPLPARVLELESHGLHLPVVPGPEAGLEGSAAEQAPKAAKQRKSRCGIVC